MGPLQSRVADSRSRELQRRYARWREAGLGELALAVATRLAVCMRVVQRFGELLDRVKEEVADWGKLDAAIEEQFCFQPADKGLPYEICAAVDALIFELRSLYEVLGKFATTFSTVILGRQVREEELLGALRNAGGNTEWIGLVRESRKLFFHETAPWIALQVHQRHPFIASLLVMKENISQFDDPSKYVTEGQLREAVEGLGRAIPAVRSWLERNLAEVEAEHLNAS